MNKLLIVLLAVCLVSVHAFVKRDADAPTTMMPISYENFQREIQTRLEDLSKKTKEVLDPEALKAGLNKMIDDISKVLKSTDKGTDGAA